MNVIAFLDYSSNYRNTGEIDLISTGRFVISDQARRESHSDQTLLTQRQAREGEQVDSMALDVIHS